MSAADPGPSGLASSGSNDANAAGGPQPHSHLAPAFRHVANLPDKDRLRFLEAPRWLQYPAATAILDELERLFDMPKRHRMPNLLIVGDANNGKTTLVRHFAGRHPEYIDDGAVEAVEPVTVAGRRPNHIDEWAVDAVKPVIVAEAPPSADERGLYVSLLERSAAPYKASLHVSQLRYQAIETLRSCRTKVLVIDEFHSLLTGTATKQREAMNAIKLLCNELAIPIVGVGTAEAVQVLHHDPQHASRFDVLPLPLWTLSREFQVLLASFESVLPLRQPSNIGHPELAATIHSICDGNIGNLHRLLIQCATDAIRSGAERITKDIVQDNSWLRPTDGIRELRL